MARTYTPKGVHTSPSKAGAKNLENMDLPQDEGLNAKLLPVREKGKANIYKGQWTDEELMASIDEFFSYCMENDVKPTMPLLRMWLGISRDQFNEWRTNKAKYGEKSVIIGMAVDFMEAYLQANMDKYPTGSIFLLKTSHGHVETSKVDVTTNNIGNTADDVKDLVSKLGLDKPTTPTK